MTQSTAPAEEIVDEGINEIPVFWAAFFALGGALGVEGDGFSGARLLVSQPLVQDQHLDPLQFLEVRRQVR